MTALRFASFDDEFLEPTLSILKIIDKHGKFHEKSAIFQHAPTSISVFNKMAEGSQSGLNPNMQGTSALSF